MVRLITTGGGNIQEAERPPLLLTSKERNKSIGSNMQKNQGTVSPSSYLNVYDRDIVKAERQRAELDRVIAALRTAREAMAGVILDGATQPRQNGDGSRAAILREILASTPEPVTVDDIMAELRKRGRHDEKNNVRSSLAAMKARGDIKNVDRGRYTAATQIAA